MGIVSGPSRHPTDVPFVRVLVGNVWFGCYTPTKAHISSISAVMVRVWELAGHSEPEQKLYKAELWMKLCIWMRYMSDRSCRQKKSGRRF